MRPTYNRGGRVRARSVGPNPTGAANPHVSIAGMKKKPILVEESEFDVVLTHLLKSAPKPIDERKISSNRGRPKTSQTRPKKSAS